MHGYNIHSYMNTLYLFRNCKVFPELHPCQAANLLCSDCIRPAAPRETQSGVYFSDFQFPRALARYGIYIVTFGAAWTNETMYNIGHYSLTNPKSTVLPLGHTYFIQYCHFQSIERLKNYPTSSNLNINCKPQVDTDSGTTPYTGIKIIYAICSFIARYQKQLLRQQLSQQCLPLCSCSVKMTGK